MDKNNVSLLYASIDTLAPITGREPTQLRRWATNCHSRGMFEVHSHFVRKVEYFNVPQFVAWHDRMTRTLNLPQPQPTPQHIPDSAA